MFYWPFPGSTINPFSLQAKSLFEASGWVGAITGMGFECMSSLFAKWDIKATTQLSAHSYTRRWLYRPAGVRRIQLRHPAPAF